MLINAGNANAVPGKQGLDNARRSCEYVASELNIDPEQVLPFSTGVIGEQLPIDKVKKAINGLGQNLSEDNWLQAANTIMTTDTIAKGVSEQVEVNGKTVRLPASLKALA